MATKLLTKHNFDYVFSAAWYQITQEKIIDLINSMPERDKNFKSSINKSIKFYFQILD